MCQPDRGESAELGGPVRVRDRKLVRPARDASSTHTSPRTANPLTPCTSLNLLYRDGWTISGGVGHKFTDKLSGAASITWDRGTSHGFGTQTDTWTFGTGLSYAATENLEFRLAGAVGILTGGSSGPQVYQGQPVGTDVKYDFDDDYFAAVSTSIKIKF